VFDNRGKSKDPLALDVVVDLRLGRFTFVYLSGFTAHIQVHTLANICNTYYTMRAGVVRSTRRSALRRGRRVTTYVSHRCGTSLILELGLYFRYKLSPYFDFFTILSRTFYKLL
jgi:hypothetical protein